MNCHLFVNEHVLGYVHTDTSTSSESKFQFTAHTSFTRMSEHS